MVRDLVVSGPGLTFVSELICPNQWISHSSWKKEKNEEGSRDGLKTDKVISFLFLFLYYLTSWTMRYLILLSEGTWEECYLYLQADGISRSDMSGWESRSQPILLMAGSLSQKFKGKRPYTIRRTHNIPKEKKNTQQIFLHKKPSRVGTDLSNVQVKVSGLYIYMYVYIYRERELSCFQCH